MRTARRLVIRGRVQGVGFRWFTQAAAVREGVAGYVANRPDGAVEVFVEGDAAAVDRVERSLRMGPPGAQVDDVSISDEPAGGAFKTFSIRHNA